MTLSHPAPVYASILAIGVFPAACTSALDSTGSNDAAVAHSAEAIFTFDVQYKASKEVVDTSSLRVMQGDLRARASKSATELRQTLLGFRDTRNASLARSVAIHADELGRLLEDLQRRGIEINQTTANDHLNTLALFGAYRAELIERVPHVLTSAEFGPMPTERLQRFTRDARTYAKLYRRPGTDLAPRATLRTLLTHLLDAHARLAEVL